jgi:hypothetical protein
MVCTTGLSARETDGNAVTPQSNNAAPRSSRWREFVLVAILESLLLS